MTSASCPTCQFPCFHTFLRIALLVLPLPIVTVILSAVLYAQDSNSSKGDVRVVIPQVPGQVQTSAQNPVFGSVPDEKPTPGVLSLTFKDAIERALKHNLAGLLSSYNTIEARGEKWQQLSDLLPNISADV